MHLEPPTKLATKTRVAEHAMDLFQTCLDKPSVVRNPVTCMSIAEMFEELVPMFVQADIALLERHARAPHVAPATVGRDLMLAVMRQQRVYTIAWSIFRTAVVADGSAFDTLAANDMGPGLALVKKLVTRAAEQAAEAAKAIPMPVRVTDLTLPPLSFFEP